MDDYLYLPKCSDISTEGVVLFTTQISAGPGETISLDYRVGYLSSRQHTIKVGCYKENTTFGYTHYWVFGSSVSISGAGVNIENGYGVPVLSINNITTSTGTGGYYARGECAVSPLTGAVINVTVFDSLQEVLNAFEFEPPPGPGTGIVVTANASPTVEPPSTNGVIVTAVARLVDPSVQGGISGPGGGQGTFDDTSGHVPIPLLPSISATDTGLVTLFRPTVAQLTELSSYLWTNLSDFIENLNKLFANPMDYLIALSIFPCSPEVGTEQAIKIGSFTTTINMPPVISSWYEQNCGTINITEWWGAAFDYSPYTKINLFLPFIGSVALNTDEVMGKTLGLRYRIDLLSGQCVALVTVNDDVYYQFTGSCSVSIPLTGSDWSRIYSAAIGAIGSIAAGAAGGFTVPAIAAPVSESVQASAISKPVPPPIINESKGPISLKKDAAVATQQASTQSSEPSRALNSSRIVNTLNDTVGQVMSGKTSVQHTGAMSGAASVLGYRTPFVIIEYPKQSLPDNYEHFYGYPSNIYTSLGEVHGYAEVEKVLLSIPGTDPELAELNSALRGGVYL